MQLKQAPNDVQSMSQDGDAILRSLQNKSLPVIDLMVRESLQNSLDASLPESENTIVDFKTGTFNNKALAQHFEGISDDLNSRYDKEQNFIAVIDKNTTGLTGDFKSNDPSILNKSNFHKLVFGIGKNQEADGAGGSWGLGKTSYFRLGIGIVIYYTRVKLDNNEYQERLIASLIESPKQENRLLPDNGRGIAWWGEFDSNDTDNRIYPLTDSNEIFDILNLFGLENYKNDETGTTILIPYIGNNEMYRNEKSSEDINPWEHNIDDEINMAIQRWYNPRLVNYTYTDKFNRPKLICGVNSAGLVPKSNTAKIFDIFQDLYTSALKGSPTESDITVRAIKLTRRGLKEPNKTPVGYIAFTEYRNEGPVSPLKYIGATENEDNQNNSKIIAYSRMPGMVVEYSVNGDWAPKSHIQKDDHLLLGFFVPNSNGKLVESYQKDGYETLEQYLRATENADHANWIDEDGYGLIRRMKEYTAKAINTYFQGDSNDKQSSATSGLSRKFGKKFMPPKGFGKNSRRKDNSKEGNTINVGSRNRISDIRVINSNPIDEHNVEVSFEASIKKESDNRIFLQVLSQEKKLNPKEWYKSFDDVIPFPFEINDLFIESIDEEQINQSYTEFSDDNIHFSQSPKEKYELLVSNTISQGILLRGVIKIYSHDNQFIPNIAISSEVNKGGDS
ncbi:hypothetical protein [Staphylococcus simulans]|uniref:hypothetical protein n=1 Tax=Staphylococcus simulans TaxID=1286 RepID=UPI000E6A1373|nr:hypothetical protein [Staphylococcus simulans]RIN55578.1 hypothetical protein BU029_02040 [Staphylococcus simulans]